MGQPRRRLNWSIRNRIMVPYLVLIVAMVGITGLASGQWAASSARALCIERGRSIGATLQRSWFPLTDSVLRQLKGLGDAEFALLDAEGRVRSSTLGDPATGHPAAEAHLGRSTPPGSDLSFDRAWSRDGITYRIATVDRPSSSGAPRLLILLPEPRLQAAAWQARRAVLVLSLVGAVLAASLATWIGRGLSRPLSALLQAIRRIGRGDFQPSGLPRRADEIGELADGVAQMADWLRRFQEERVRTERLRLIQQVSAGLAHELRNPLTAARMTLQIFIERNRDRDAEPLRVALSELGRMERQVRRFLQIARPEPPRLEVVEVGPILLRGAAGLAATAEHRGIALEVEPPEGPIRVRTDPEQLGQVIANLGLNALDACGRGGRVRLRARPSPSGTVWIDVEDDGPGIPPDDEPRLFQPFFSTKPEGVGLGLALCAALMQEHGGHIAYGRSDGWTRFRVHVPGARIGRDPPGGPWFADSDDPARDAEGRQTLVAAGR